MDLYISRGYDRTTAADIAQAVGLTERTFFRHFADKREVLFSGQELLEQAFLDGAAAAAPDASPLELVESALSARRRSSRPSAATTPGGGGRSSPRILRCRNGSC